MSIAFQIRKLRARATYLAACDKYGDGFMEKAHKAARLLGEQEHGSPEFKEFCTITRADNFGEALAVWYRNRQKAHA